MIKHTITQWDIDNKMPFTNINSVAGDVVDIEGVIETGQMEGEETTVQIEDAE